jgi:hypothetical protein
MAIEHTRVRRLFWDIETSPNIGFFWRPGWKITIDPDNIIHERAVICICWKWEDQKKVNHLRWRKGCDMEMICKFVEVLEEADEAVAHNGDKFDMGWYNGRHLIHGLEPIPKTKTVDTYKIAARNFNLNSYKLDYLAKILLGEGKIKDVVLLERVWKRLSAYIDPETHAAVMATGNVRDRWRCKHCGSDHVKKSKTNVTKAGMIQHQMQCLNCGRYYTVADLVFRWYKEAKELYG